MMQIIFYVPPEFAAQVKQSMFAVGAGKIGNYDNCSWETEGVGQFRALRGSNPFIGQEGQIETLRELKVEMVCSQALVPAALEALKKSHPYETPAYFVVSLSL